MTATAQTDSPYIGLVFEVWTSDYLTKRGVAICTATHASNADTLTFKNLGTTAFTTVSGDKFVLQSHLSGTGQTAPNAWSDELSVVWNSTGITRIAVEIEGTLYRAALRGATNELERLRKQKMRQHKIWEERKLLRGMSVLGTNLAAGDSFADTWRTDASTKKIRSTMGLITALELYGEDDSAEDDQNVFDFTAGCDYNQWIEATEKIWQYLPESGVRDFYCGPKALSFWSKIDEQGKTRSGFQIQLSDMRSDVLGVYFKYLETPFGLSRLIYTPALRREYNNIMLAATPENLFHAIYAPTTYYTNIKTENNYDGIKDEYYSDTGIGITLIESHSLVKMPKN